VTADGDKLLKVKDGFVAPDKLVKLKDSDTPVEGTVEWYIKLFLSVHFADNLA
jgi:hypothetical protein